MANIKSIVYQPNGRSDPKGISGFDRVVADSVELVKAHGIQGDRKAGRSKSRQLNLLTTDWLVDMAALGYKTGPGEFGEQLIVDGIGFSDLRPGVQLALGPDAVIEITKARTGCDRLDNAQGKRVETSLRHAIGYLAQVVHGGVIRVGDQVRVLQES